MKSIKLKGISLIGFLLLHLSVYSQEINVGDCFSKAEFVANYFPDKSLSESDLKGKWILLDFWSHTCISCLQSFTDLDSFQKEFGNQIQIILVNRESKDSTDRFFSKRKKIHRPNLPFISGDTSLYKRFPHNGVPYHAWIDSTETVRYMAYGSTTTRDKIKKLLDDNLYNPVSYKKVKYISSLFDSVFFNSLEYFSYISHCDPAYNLQASERNNYDQVCLKCSSIAELYIEAYNDFKRFPLTKPGRVVIEATNPSMYLRPENQESLESWYKESSYNYHLLLPESKKEEKYEIMKADLKRYFNLKARVEKRKIKCLVLKRTSKINKLKSKGGSPINNFYFADESSSSSDSIRYLRNFSYSFFSGLFANYIEFNLKRPFIDSTLLNGKIDIQFLGSTIDTKNYHSLRNDLKKYDLDLVEMDVWLDVLVLKD